MALACVGASLQRLRYLYAATSFDPELFGAAARGDAGRAIVPHLLSEARQATSDHDERELFDALAAGPTRASDVTELLLDFDFRFERWARVPRVCASVASSLALLSATWSMRIALRSAPALEAEGFRAALDGAVANAVSVAACGVVGTVACVAVLSEARRVALSRRSAFDKWVHRVEAVLGGPGDEGGEGRSGRAVAEAPT